MEVWLDYQVGLGQAHMIYNFPHGDLVPWSSQAGRPPLG